MGGLLLMKMLTEISNNNFSNHKAWRERIEELRK